MSFLVCVLLEQNTYSPVFKQLTKLFQSLQQVLVWKPTRMTKCNEKIERGKCEEFPLWSFFLSMKNKKLNKFRFFVVFSWIWELQRKSRRRPLNHFSLSSFSIQLRKIDVKRAY